MDYGTIFLSMRAAIARADSASDAWMAIVRIADGAGARVAEDVRTVDIETDTASVGTQLRSITMHRPPQGMDFLYFGLYDAYDETTGGTLPGFYLAGGRGENPEEAVYEAPLPYRPQPGDLESRVLMQIRRAADADEAQLTFYEYVLTFAAAAILAKFASRTADLTLPLLVGFDSGDILAVR